MNELGGLPVDTYSFFISHVSPLSMNHTYLFLSVLDLYEFIHEALMLHRSGIPWELTSKVMSPMDGWALYFHYQQTVNDWQRVFHTVLMGQVEQESIAMMQTTMNGRKWVVMF